MKNRNIQFKPTLGLVIPLLLVCLAAVFISATNLARAGEMVPFNGTVSGYVDSQSGTECEPSIHVVNFGHANQLGAFTGTAEFSPHPCAPDPDLCKGEFWLLPFVPAVLCLLAVRTTAHVIGSAQDVARTNEVEKKLEWLFSNLKDIEVFQRSTSSQAMSGCCSAITSTSPTSTLSL